MTDYKQLEDFEEHLESWTPDCISVDKKMFKEYIKQAEQRTLEEVEMELLKGEKDHIKDPWIRGGILIALDRVRKLKLFGDETPFLKGFKEQGDGHK